MKGFEDFFGFFKSYSLSVSIGVIVFLIGILGCIFLTGLKLGHLPVYGVDADPTAPDSGLMVITFILFLFFTSLVLIIPLWFITDIILSIKEKSWKLFLNRYSIITIVGILIFFSIKYGMPEQFAWFND